MFLFRNYKFITFDSYYDIPKYNEIISAAIQNKIEFRQFISIKAPFKWYLMLKKEDLPKFLIYDEITESEYKWIVSVVRPSRPNEAYLLERRPGQDTSYWKYLEPVPLKNLSKRKYLMVFYTYDNALTRQFSKELGKSKIYQLPKLLDLKRYRLNICFNPYIKGIVPKENVLLEFGNNDKTKDPVPKHWSDVEFKLNYFKLVQEKVYDKPYELPYFENGVYNPLKISTFLV